MKFFRKFALPLLAVASLMLGACASTQPKPYAKERINQKSWNTPQSWEGSPMGAFFSGTR